MNDEPIKLPTWPNLVERVNLMDIQLKKLNELCLRIVGIQFLIFIEIGLVLLIVSC